MEGKAANKGCFFWRGLEINSVILLPRVTIWSRYLRGILPVCQEGAEEFIHQIPLRAALGGCRHSSDVTCHAVGQSILPKATFRPRDTGPGQEHTAGECRVGECLPFPTLVFDKGIKSKREKEKERKFTKKKKKKIKGEGGRRKFDFIIYFTSTMCKAPHPLLTASL